MGGKAFEDKTQRINLDDIQGTLDWLTSKWKGSAAQGGDYMHHLLGSAGKNDTSGDLDLNLNWDLFDQSEVAKELIHLLGEDAVKARPGNNQIFTAVPILGDAKNGYVQVDFMFGNYNWQKFSYFSSSYANSIKWASRRGSYFKGLYRTEFLKALTAFNSVWVLEDNSEIIARVGPTFFHDRGCVWRYRHRPMRQDGKGRVQTFKEVTKEEFLDLYPSAITVSSEAITDPQVFCDKMFDPYVKPGDMDTIEYIAYVYRRYYHASQRETIEKMFSERLNNLKADLRTADFSRIYLTVK